MVGDNLVLYGFVIHDLSLTRTDGCPPLIFAGSEHATLVPMDKIPDGTYPEDIFVQGNYLYYTAGHALYIYNVKDPSYPYLVKTFDTSPYDAHEIVVSGDYAYLTVDIGWRLYVLDVSEFNK